MFLANLGAIPEFQVERGFVNLFMMRSEFTQSFLVRLVVAVAVVGLFWAVEK